MAYVQRRSTDRKTRYWRHDVSPDAAQLPAQLTKTVRRSYDPNRDEEARALVQSVFGKHYLSDEQLNDASIVTSPFGVLGTLKKWGVQ